MEIILREEVEHLGTRGQVVKVAAGYARNFLLPRNLAVPATSANKKIIEQERQAWLRREATEKSQAEELKKMLDDVSLTISQKAGDQDQLFGSVTSADIVEALLKQNFEIDRRKIQLDSPIKQLGEYQVPIRLHKDVTAEVRLMVERAE